jgi:hypothetical protein
MRQVTKRDYDHLEFCGGELSGDYGLPVAFVIDRIGDFFWNKDDSEDGKFSMRLHAEDIAFRAPERILEQLAAERFTRWSTIPRPWAVICRCGALTLTTVGVMRFWDEGSLWPLQMYVHFAPGFRTNDPEID